MKSPLKLLLLLPAITMSSSLTEGWELLLNNKPEDALKYFQTFTPKSVDEQTQKLRGEIAVLSFLGKDESLGKKAAKTFELSGDPLALALQANALHHWSLSNKSGDDSYVLKQLQKAIETGALTTPHFYELVNAKYRVLGKSKKAIKAKEESGIISKWHAIGPFENSAGSGYNSVFPPEISIVPDTTYEGKSRNSVSWYPIHGDNTSPWTFLNNHAEGFNNTYYLATSVTSAKAQKGYLTFGASANFKIFQNGEQIVADSIFRNTGINSYLTPVSLAQGVNTFVVKLGYERMKANFALGILNEDFQKFPDVQQLSELVPASGNVEKSEASNTLMLDTISTLLTARIENDSTDLEAVSYLCGFLMIHDQGDRAENLIHEYLRKYPESGYLESLLAGILLRRGHITEASQRYRRAYELCPEGDVQWEHELTRFVSEDDRAAANAFLEKTSPVHHDKLEYTTARMQLKAQEGKIAQAMLLLDSIAEKFSDANEAAVLLHTIYAEGGQSKDAIKVLKEAAKRNMFSSNILYLLADYHLQSGNTPEALKVYNKIIKIFPNEPRAYYMIASLYTSHKQFDMALPYIEHSLQLTPNSVLAYRLKGQILQQLGNPSEAIQTYEEAIKRTDDDFLAWESLREVEGKPSWQALAPVQSYRDVIKEALPWADSIGEPVSILTYNEDVFRYPSKAIRRREYFVINLADRNSIEEWQEYAIPFNGHSERLQVLTALTVKADGSTVIADRNRNHIVFKSLEPGDNIVVEYTIEEHQHSGMSGKLYGETEFTTSIPAYSQTLRFITPENDPISYRQFGDLPEPAITSQKDFRITTFTVMKQEGDDHNSFTPSEFSGKAKVVYSDFKSWEEISNWYLQLTAQKGEDNPAIRSLADSLFKGLNDPWEKLKRTQEYITTNIAYSFIPFRQSGWVPQGTGEILATRIGDCKDMSLLGRTLLRFGGVQADLVLVNTGIFDYTEDAFIGPNFDHAILAATIDDSTHFVDLTSKNSSLDALPVPDQGAMALMVTEGSDSVFTLPVDSPKERRISRNIEIALHEDGSVEVSSASTKSSVFASMMRNIYRYKSEKKQKSTMEEQIQSDNESISVSSLSFEGLDSLDNVVKYKYSYIVDNGISLGTNTALYKLPMPEQINSNYFPVIHERTVPITLRQYYRGISEQDATITVTYPETWNLTNKLEDQNYVSADGTYSLKFSQEQNKIVIERKVTADFNRIYTVEEFKENHEFLSNALLADNLELIFTK